MYQIPIDASSGNSFSFGHWKFESNIIPFDKSTQTYDDKCKEDQWKCGPLNILFKWRSNANTCFLIKLIMVKIAAESVIEEFTYLSNHKFSNIKESLRFSDSCFHPPSEHLNKSFIYNC